MARNIHNIFELRVPEICGETRVDPQKSLFRSELMFCVLAEKCGADATHAEMDPQMENGSGDLHRSNF
jgi:hypothetical protein